MEEPGRMNIKKEVRHWIKQDWRSNRYDRWTIDPSITAIFYIRGGCAQL